MIDRTNKPKFEEIEYMSRIWTHYDSLTLSEKKIADYVLSNKEELFNISIHSLASRVGVSSPTITRFCRNLHFNSFSEFKYYIEKELLSSVGEIGPLGKEDSIKIIKQKLVKFNKEILDDTMATLDDDKLEKAIEVISKAKKIEIYGEGGSGAIALSAHYIFLQIGLPSSVYNDAIFQMISASQVKSNDVVIGISHSGSVVNTVEALKVAKQQGATTICITGYLNSPITKVSDIVLYASSKQKPFISDLPAARISELCVVDILQVGIIARNYDRLVEKMKMSKRAINLKRLKG
jgi:DNA-binding MurR/RpiR family transcriptional regulator